MAKLNLPAALFGAAVLSVGAVAILTAQSDDTGVIGFPGTVHWSWATRPSPDIHPHDPNPAGLVTIYSNLGTRNDLYVDNAGWDVAGPNSGVQQQWVAMPFTPSSNALATQISIAVEHNTGSPNSFVLSLNVDNNRFPGTALHTWIVHNAPKYGTCCAIDVAKDSLGIALTKGTQYWIVASLNTSESASRMEWDISTKAIEEFFAFNNGHGWTGFTAFASAFAVYGKATD
jgi:hypothetical protein